MFSSCTNNTTNKSNYVCNVCISSSKNCISFSFFILVQHTMLLKIPPDYKLWTKSYIEISNMKTIPQVLLVHPLFTHLVHYPPPPNQNEKQVRIMPQNNMTSSLQLYQLPLGSTKMTLGSTGSNVTPVVKFHEIFCYNN